MAKIQQQSAAQNGRLNYEDILSKYPWIAERNQQCILDPDSDGFFCGLFMSNFLDWQVKGFYDGKILILEEGISPANCIFLDREIFRDNIKSIGHHMLLFNKKRIPKNWDNFKNCIQPNNIRNYDFYTNFSLKYPLATIHLLIGILRSFQDVDIPKSAICPLLFTDGTWMNLFEYTENSLDWIEFLKAKELDSLSKVFCNDEYSVHTMMVAMNKFLRKRDDICAAREKGPRERGDRLIISTAEGPYNLDESDGSYSVKSDAKDRAEEFLKLLASLTGWGYKSENWIWRGMKIYNFTKKIFSKKSRLSNKNFEKIISKNPLSYAMSSNLRIEYTLEKPDTLMGH